MGSRQRARRKRAGGRDVQITDDQLFQRREGFILLFVEAWGQIGWELPRVRTPEELVAVLCRIEAPVYLAPLMTPYASATLKRHSASDVRHARRTERAVRQRTLQLEERLRPLAERVRESRDALRLVSERNVDAVRSEHHRRLLTYGELRAEADDADQELARLESASREVEASYAQHELLDYLKTGKYKHTPRNLAHAVAGLPLIGCSQSFRRCCKNERPWPPPRFQTFELIEKSSRVSESTFADELRRRIMALPDRNPLEGAFKKSMCEDWHYLRRAIEEQLPVDGSPESLPHRVYAAYLANVTRPRTLEDSVVASLERVEYTPKPHKTRMKR